MTLSWQLRIRHLWRAELADGPHQQPPVGAQAQQALAQHQQLQDAGAVALQPPLAAQVGWGIRVLKFGL